MIKSLIKCLINRSKKYRHQFVQGKGKKALIFCDHLGPTYYLYIRYPLENIGLCFKAFPSSSIPTDKIENWAEELNQSFCPDYVIFSRYALPHGEKLLSFFKSKGVLCFYQIDDMLLELEEHLGSKVNSNHNRPEVLRARLNLLNQVDYVCASTPALAENLSKRLNRKNILYGPPPPYLGELIEKPSQRILNPSRFTIGYAGSKSHKGELSLIEKGLFEIMTQQPKIHFEIAGTLSFPQNWLETFPNRMHHLGSFQPYPNFLEKLCTMTWNIGIAPLVESNFNSNKSYIKLLEYALAGIPSLASNHPVYRECSNHLNIKLVDKDNWGEAFSKMFHSKSNFEQAPKEKISKYSIDNSSQFWNKHLALNR